MNNLKRYIQFFIMYCMVVFFTITLLDGLSQYLFPKQVHAMSIVKRFFLTILCSVGSVIAIIRQRKKFKKEYKYDMIKYFDGDESGYPQGRALPEPDGKTPRIILYLIVFFTFFLMVGVVSTFVDLIDCLRNAPCRFANIMDRLLWMLYFNVGIMLLLIALRPMGIVVLKIFEDNETKTAKIPSGTKSCPQACTKNHKQGILTTQ